MAFNAEMTPADVSEVSFPCIWNSNPQLPSMQNLSTGRSQPQLSPMGDLVGMTATLVRLGVCVLHIRRTSCDKILHLLRYLWPPHRGRNLKSTSLNSLVSMMYFHQNLILKTLWYDNSHTMQYTVLSTESLSPVLIQNSLYCMFRWPSVLVVPYSL